MIPTSLRRRGAPWPFRGAGGKVAPGRAPGQGRPRVPQVTGVSQVLTTRKNERAFLFGASVTHNKRNKPDLYFYCLLWKHLEFLQG